MGAGCRDAVPTRTLSSLERAERETLMLTLQECKGNKSLAAAKFSVARSPLYRKMRPDGLNKDRSFMPEIGTAGSSSQRST